MILLLNGHLVKVLVSIRWVNIIITTVVCKQLIVCLTCVFVLLVTNKQYGKLVNGKKSCEKKSRTKNNIIYLLGIYVIIIKLCIN